MECDLEVTKITGRCACGQVSYYLDSSPEFMMLCQCRQSQYISGGGHLPQLAISDEFVSMEGKFHTYQYQSDSEHEVTSHFCPSCGNPIFKTTNQYSDLLFFTAGSLDNGSMFKPQFVAHCQSAQAWDKCDTELKRI